MLGPDISVGIMTMIRMEEEENTAQFPTEKTDFFLASYIMEQNSVPQTGFRKISLGIPREILEKFKFQYTMKITSNYLRNFVFC
jgi:hypothetical protein